MRVLITGATGFLGGALARHLHTLGHDVTGTGRSPERGAALAADGPTFAAADLEDAQTIATLCVSQDVVVHCGALTGAWGRPDAFHRANVRGTGSVVRGCQAANVGRLVHISTPSVGQSAAERTDVREDDPLPARHANAYTRTKAAAEDIVRDAAAGGLHAVILRPRALFGPGDTTLFPRLLRAIEAGRFRILGDEHAVSDLTFIDNAVAACVLAATVPGARSGVAYHITDGAPVPLWRVLRRVAAELDLPFPTRRVNPRVAYAAARALELTHRVFRPDVEPAVTAYAVHLLTHTHTLCIDRARDELGYAAKVSTDEGLTRFIAHTRAARAPTRETPR